ncbi:TIR domain-containing protein [Streptomyces sp. NPDC003832]
MMWVEAGNLGIGLVSVLLTAVGVWFTYPGHRTRRAGAGPAPAPTVPPVPQAPSVPPEPSGSRQPYDALVAYADGDADAAELLARKLHEAELHVFLARWVEPGLVPLTGTDHALTEVPWGVLLFGSGTLADGRACDEYAALLHRKHEGGLRFVPARTTHDPLPPLAAIHQALDLTRPGTDHYEQQVARLVRLIRAARPAAGA